MRRDRPFYYRLDGHTPVPIEGDDQAVAEEVLRNADARRVAFTRIPALDCKVSTVFLTIDHAWADDARPLLFETMVFKGVMDGQCWRYSTWDEAEAGHERVVRHLEAIAAARDRLHAKHGNDAG